MESRLIYKLTRYRTNDIEIHWLNSTFENGAWIYIGDGEQINREFVLKKINEHFTDNILYVSWTRNESIEMSKENIESAIKGILGEHDFSIWDSKLRKVIQFNKNGVMRLGEK